MNRRSFCQSVAWLAFALGGSLGCGDNNGGRMVHEDVAIFYIEAMKVRTQDQDKCLELLEKSIHAMPTGSAYFHRAWIFAKRAAIDEAAENVQMGLEIEPQNTNLLWLAEELKKPVKKRSFKMPPSSGK